MRPPLEHGQPGYELIPQRFQRSIVQVTSNTSLFVESPQGKRNFVFDRVFNENVGQEGVMDWLKESIESFVTGYNVSLLAYGQSGAGKSYTMGTSGPDEQNDPWQMGRSLTTSRANGKGLFHVPLDNFSQSWRWKTRTRRPVIQQELPPVQESVLRRDYRCS